MDTRGDSEEEIESPRGHLVISGDARVSRENTCSIYKSVYKSGIRLKKDKRSARLLVPHTEKASIFNDA